ncbi:MAG: CPBP family intramembrane metalloprotease [Thermoplasmata archaeon]|nr:CPBP family intramembrane metalloprotease [Thermoplasmata archaeon]MBE3137427.1 CPBP family intramembrane metalloprotease [Thermoplasmata archaeon]MBE3139098.1 CPBP family intramembrane metalloprotease [Thermoplasmata archaeon]
MDNLSTPLGGALSIFILGLIFGYVAHRSKSVSGSIITHILNNLFNA